MKLGGRAHVGMRTVKTTIAVFLCLLVDYVFHWSSAAFAVVAAVICMQRTSSETLQRGGERVIATTIGTAAGFAVLMLGEQLPGYHQGLYLLAIPLGTMATLYVTLLIGQQTSAALSVIMYLSTVCILDRGPVDTVQYVLVRYLGTLIGIAAAGLVNRFIAPYREEEALDEELYWK